MSYLNNQKESDGIKQVEAALAEFGQRIKQNLVECFIEKNMPPEQIAKDLVKGKLIKPSEKSSSLERYIQNNFSMVWNADESVWVPTNQVGVLKWVDEMYENFSWENVPIRLSKNDSETVLKDMKQIVKDLKHATTDLARIARNVDKLAVLVNPGINESTEKEVESYC